MGFGLRRLALACLLIVVSATVAVAGGSAANRDGVPTFVGVAGAGGVTTSETIAYRATLENAGASTFTHVKFRMRVPYAATGSPPYPEATFVASTCPSTPAIVSTPSGPEWICSFPNMPSGADVALVVLWKAPALASAADCADCLRTNGRWTIKEGINDVVDPNDAFPPGGIDRSATLLSGSGNPTQAGGYETELEPCTDPLGAGSLRTQPAVDPVHNPVATTVCLPSPIPSSATDLGLATTIVEGPGDDGNPAGHPALGRSDVCIATLGQSCGPEGLYIPHDFGTLTPATFVFRIAVGALPAGEKIRQVFHNGTALPRCDKKPHNPDGCTVSIRLDKASKVWTVVATAPTNGPWTW